VQRRALHAFPTRRSSDLKSRSRYSKRCMPSRNAISIGPPSNELGLYFSKNLSLVIWKSKHASFLPTTLLARRNSGSTAIELHARSEEHTSELQSRENIVC